MTKERLFVRCDQSVQTNRFYIHDPELVNLSKRDIDMYSTIEDSIFIPHFTRQAKPCFDYLIINSIDK